MKPTLLILAAGMGSRYGGLKQLDQLGPHGETIMDYSVNDAMAAGFGKVVFVIRKHMEEDFKRYILSKYEHKIAVDYVFQELDMLPDGVTLNPDRVKPYGTGHAVLVAKDAIKEPFAVINADDFYGRDAFMTMGRFLTKEENMASHHYAMVGYQLNKTLSEFGTVSRGICETNDRHELTAITEMTKIRRYDDGIKNVADNGEVTLLGETTPVSMNFWGFMPNIFNLMEKMFVDFMKENNDNPKSEFFIPLVVNYLISSKTATIQVLESDAEWFGVTYQEDRPSVVEKLKSVKY
ncbi:MAG: NTP transferase domain-containing protein [Bacteroidales bacterium]|nr:NTP transferase domain-containing protein [Bacteroidales bacterium]